MRKLLPFALFLAARVWALEPGGVVRDFTLKGTDEKQYRLSTLLLENEAAVVVFLSARCPYSNSYNDRYNRLTSVLSSLNGKKVAFLAVNSLSAETLDEIRKHAADKQYVFPVLLDAQQEAARAFGAEVTPEAFLVDKQRRILYRGRIDDDTDGKKIESQDLLLALKQHLEARPVAVKRTRGFGCVIPRLPE